MEGSPAPSLPAINPSLREKAERIQSLTEEMIAGKTVDDWGRVVAAETERRPLIYELVEEGFRTEGGELADAWLYWLLEVDRDIMERGEDIRDEMGKARRQAVAGGRVARAYKKNQTVE